MRWSARWWRTARRPGRSVDRNDRAEEPEALRRDGLDGQAEPAADHLGDRAQRVALVRDGVGHGAGAAEVGGVAFTQAYAAWIATDDQQALGDLTDAAMDRLRAALVEFG